LATGTTEGTRVGQEVNFRRFKCMFEVIAGSQNVATPDSRTEAYMRLVFWTPRVDSVKALAYMATISPIEIFDWNVITVHRDYIFRLSALNGPTFNTAGTFQGVQPISQPSTKYIKVNIPFPRKAKFAPTSVTGFNDINPDKDVMYYSLYSDFVNVLNAATYSFTSRITYTDA